MSFLFGWWRRRTRRLSDRLLPVSDRIAEGAVFRGTLRGHGHYLVCGEVQGRGEIEGGLTIAPPGRWKGDIQADRILIAGEVIGDVTARERMEIAAGARIRGDLSAPAIAIAEGAQHDGQLRVARKSQITHFREQRGQGKR
jgi:cytoskeletal protein CcmA (bactofilin family)